MHTDKDLAAANSSEGPEKQEDIQEENLEWLLDMEDSEPEDTLFAVEGDEYEDTGLSAFEAQVAARPMTRGNDKGDDLDNYVAEEIVISSDAASNDIFGSAEVEEEEQVQEDESGGEESMAIDFTRRDDAHSAARARSLDEGADVLGLESEDDIGDMPLAIQRVKSAPRKKKRAVKVAAAAAEQEQSAVAAEKTAAETMVDESTVITSRASTEALDDQLLSTAMTDSQSLATAVGGDIATTSGDSEDSAPALSELEEAPTPTQVADPQQPAVANEGEEESPLVAAQDAEAPTFEGVESQAQELTLEDALDDLEIEAVAGEATAAGIENDLDLEFDDSFGDLDDLSIETGSAVADLDDDLDLGADDDLVLEFDATIDGLEELSAEVAAEPAQTADEAPAVAQDDLELEFDDLSAEAASPLEYPVSAAPDNAADDLELEFEDSLGDLDDLQLESAGEVAAFEDELSDEASEDMSIDFESSLGDLDELPELEEELVASEDAQETDVAPTVGQLEDLALQSVVQLPVVQLELQRAADRRKTELGIAEVQLDVEVVQATVEQDVQDRLGAGFAPVTEVLNELPAALHGLPGGELESIFVRILDGEENRNGLFRETACAPAPSSDINVTTEDVPGAAATADEEVDGFGEDIFGDDLDDDFSDELDQEGAGFFSDVDAAFAALSQPEEAESDEICGVDLQEFGAESDAEDPVAEVDEEEVTAPKEVQEQVQDPVVACEAEEEEPVPVHEEVVTADVDGSDLSWCIPQDIEFSYTSQSGGEIFADFLDAFIEEGSAEIEKLEDLVSEWE